MSTVALEKNPTFWYYGSASIAYGIKNNAFSYLLLIYANQVLGLPGYKASIALAIAMLWDAVSDLFLGHWSCLLYTSPSPRDGLLSRMPSSA